MASLKNIVLDVLKNYPDGANFETVYWIGYARIRAIPSTFSDGNPSGETDLTYAITELLASGEVEAINKPEGVHYKLRVKGKEAESYAARCHEPFRPIARMALDSGFSRLYLVSHLRNLANAIESDHKYEQSVLHSNLNEEK